MGIEPKWGRVFESSRSSPATAPLLVASFVEIYNLILNTLGGLAALTAIVYAAIKAKRWWIERRKLRDRQKFRQDIQKLIRRQKQEN